MVSIGVLGAMKGLGDSVADLGSAYLKSKLADELEQGRENRAYQRKKDYAIWEQQQKDIHDTTTYDPSKDTTFIGEDGVIMTQRKSINGTPLDTVRASPQQIQEFNSKEEERRLSLDSITADIESKRATAASNNANARLHTAQAEEVAADAASERALRSAQARAATTNANASMISARNRGSGENSSSDSSSVSLMTGAQDLLNQFPSLVNTYTKGDNPKLTEAQVLDVARSSIIHAAKKGKDAASVFKNALAIYADNQGTTETGGSLGLSPGKK